MASLNIKSKRIGLVIFPATHREIRNGKSTWRRLFPERRPDAADTGIGLLVLGLAFFGHMARARWADEDKSVGLHVAR